MSTDDIAEAKSLSLISLEPNTNSQIPTDPTSVISRQQALLSVDKSLSPDESGPPKSEENEEVEVVLAKDIESRDIIEACETVNGDLESVGENAEPPPEPFVGSADSSEIAEPADAVVAWSPDEDHEHKRVKVYELIGSRWIDQGTAFCLGSFQNETQEAFIIARAESNFNDIILSTAIRGNDVYQRQQDTLIVWTEPDGVDYALSFQDPEGCSEVWNFILDVQRHMNSNSDEQRVLGSSSPLIGPNESVTATSILQSGHLPPPRMGIIGEIERAIKGLARTPNIKERVCEYIQQEEYIKSLVEVMTVAEEQENLENLHALCSLMQTILMLNDHNMYEHILEDSLFSGVVGMLEYDPEFPAHKANYREFLHRTSRFHQPIPIRDEAIQKKVHHTYRLQFMKDVVLARALDDSTFNVLNSCIIFNQIDIINHVQHDAAFLREVVGLYVDDDMLSGGGVKKKDKEGAGPKSAEGMDVDKSPISDAKPNGVSINGQSARAGLYAFAPPDELSEDEKSLRSEVVLLIQQLCVMGKNVQLPARMALFRTLVDRGILFAVQWALSLPEKDQKSKPIISSAGEVLAALLDHDLNGVRGHVLKQVVAIEKEREAKKKGADKAATILALLCKMMAHSRELAVQSQVGDALKVLLEIQLNDGPEPNTVIGVKLLSRGKDDPGTEKFLDYFYKNCIELLFRPFSDVPEFKQMTEPVLRLTREKTNLYLYLCDLLCNFAQQHSFRSHFFILSSNISPRVATLLSARDKHLRLAAFRFFRICLKLNNRNLTNHLMKCDIAKPLICLTIQESRRDNLLSSSCQELFEHLRRENLKDFINHCMTKYETEIRLLAETPLGGPRFMSFIRRWEMNNEPPPKEEKIEKPDLRIPGQSRLIEAEEENYFNADDDDTDFVPSIASPIFPRSQAPPPPLSSLKRKRRTGLNISTAFRPTLTPPRTPPIGSLVDYGDDDDDLEGLAAVERDLSASATRRDSSLQPLASSTDLLSSPRLSNRQVPSPILPRRPSLQDIEDDLLEALVRPKDSTPFLSIATPKTPDLGLGPARPSGKRQREDDDDELLERLASKAKRPDLRAEKVLPVSAGRGSKPGDDPPKKITLKFGLTSLGASSTSPFAVTPSEAGVKDGDTG